jgi:hypothetical protein
MQPTARWGSGSTQARANTGAGHSIWGSPRRRLGGGRAAVVRAWRVQEMPGREGSRSGEGKGRRVEGKSSRRWRSGDCAGGERRWQNGSRGEARVTEEEEGRQELEGPLCEMKNFQGLLYKERFSIDRKP